MRIGWTSVSGKMYVVRKQYSHRGAALILVSLITAAIALLIYYFVALRPDATLLAEQQGNPDEYPWCMEELIQKDSIDPPSPDQPKITEILELRAHPYQENGGSGGKLSLYLNPNGFMEGSWSGEFRIADENKGKEYTIMAGAVEGSILPEKIYTDEKGQQDPSTLLLLTRGRLDMIERIQKNGRVRHVNGWVYIAGWLNPDLSGSGKLHITSDKRTQVNFQWKAGPATPPTFVF